MKKVLVMLVVIFATAISAKALNLNEYEVYFKLNNESTFNSLSRYLKLNDCQYKNLKTEFQLAQERIQKAVETENVSVAQEALNANLNNLKEILSEEQYEKFVLALNTTIENNRELSILASEMADSRK